MIASHRRRAGATIVRHVDPETSLPEYPGACTVCPRCGELRFCGVFGHKPTIDVISHEGRVHPPTANPAPDRLAVNGPLARSAQDLLLGMEVAGGPVGAEGIAYSWKLPPARGSHLRDYRIGYVLDDPFCPVTAEVRQVLEKTIDALGKAGARQCCPMTLRRTVTGAPPLGYSKRRADSGPSTSATMTLFSCRWILSPLSRMTTAAAYSSGRSLPLPGRASTWTC
ncbi:MAG: hypothetical protein LAP39_08985 [Acidobacteriia bacterium]|nr:hypothetical protein [Terriglobia bacterium]